MIQNWGNQPFTYFYYPFLPFDRPPPPPFPHSPPFLESSYPYQLKKQEIQQSQNNPLNQDKQPCKPLNINNTGSNLPKKEKVQNKKIKCRKSEGDQEYQERRQTPQRNTLSNTIKYFLRYILLKPQEAENEVKIIVDEINIDFGAEMFIQSFQKEFEAKMNYISKDSIESIWLIRENCLTHLSQKQKIQFCIIFRKLFLRYFEAIIFSDRLCDKKKKKKYEGSQKKYIKFFIRELESKYRKIFDLKK